MAAAAARGGMDKAPEGRYGTAAFVGFGGMARPGIGLFSGCGGVGRGEFTAGVQGIPGAGKRH